MYCEEQVEREFDDAASVAYARSTLDDEFDKRLLEV
jgi:hypothetical protein